MPKLSKKNKKLVLSFIFFLLSLSGLLIANYLVKRKTRYQSQASQTNLNPIIIPGSLQDTGIIPERFTDVDKNSWSWKYIQQIAPLGIIPLEKTTEFHPQDPVLRYKMAGHLLRTYQIITGKNPPLVKTPFKDISHLTQEQQDAIAKIYGLKITAGTSDATFSPNMEVDRAQMITFFMNLYKAITGKFPPETEVPFTDIYNDPNYEWSIKYIKKAYNLKITAGITPTKFGPKIKTTREQMATFIFNFMRLFRPSHNNPNFKSQLADIKSIMFNRQNTDYLLMDSYYSHLVQALPYIKQTGFNTVRLFVPWASIDPKPLSKPTQYNSYSQEIILNSLKLLKQNQMKAIINLNDLGENWSPNGINYCNWTTDLNQYLAFEDYVKDFLTLIQDYADMTYLYISVEGSIPCQLDYQKDGRQIAAIIRPTIGSLTQRLPQKLREKFKIGFHDFILLTHNFSSKESPIQMPLSYDYYSNALYNHEEKTDQEIIKAIDQPINNIRAIYPFIPIFYGEYGASYCNYQPHPNSETINSTNNNQARVLKTAVTHLLNQNIGFNIWQWEGQSGEINSCPESQNNLPHPIIFGQTYFDTTYYPQPILISKPAHLEITRLLNPSASKSICVENPTFGQKIINQNRQQCRQFYSSCLPEGFTAINNITDCSELCNNEMVWTRVQPHMGGTCEGQYPSNCIPEGYYLDPTCDPNYQPNPSTTSTTPTPSPTSTNPPATPVQTQIQPSSPSELFPSIDTAQKITPSPQPAQVSQNIPQTYQVTETTEAGIVGFMDKISQFILNLFTP